MSGSPHSTQRIGIALNDQVPIGRAVPLLPTCPGVMVLAGDMPPVVAARTSPRYGRDRASSALPPRRRGARLATRPAAGMPLQGPIRSSGGRISHWSRERR